MFLVLIFIVFSLNGCALLQIPGALIGGAGKLLGTAIGLAQKVPWWLWV